MSDISEDRLYSFEKQEVIVENFDSTEYILDIGGGGEGIIGKLKGKKWLLLIPRNEAPAGPSEESRFLINPYLLVGMIEPYARIPLYGI